MKDNPILIIDGLNVFMRHFCANPSLSSNGDHVGGFLGFLGNVGSLSENFSPKKVIIVWESGGSLRRRAVMSSYKSGRRPTALNRYYEDDLPATSTNHTNQVSLLVKAFDSFPVTQIYVRGCEADDVVGYLTKYVYKKEKIVIASSDKDLHQLIDDTVVQWSPGQKRTIDKKGVIDKFGVSSCNFVTARCFVGDSSDDISGVKGVGFRSMAKWFPELGGEDFIPVSEIVERAKELSISKKGKTLLLISEASSIASRNWKLMNLDTSCLAADQIQKILGQLENRGKSNKMALLRLMAHHGMQNFDINRHFVAINSVRYRDNQE
jgi:DNA polymerase-1